MMQLVLTASGIYFYRNTAELILQKYHISQMYVLNKLWIYNKFAVSIINKKFQYTKDVVDS